MANVYVEARPKGRPEGSHIEDFVVEDHADHALATFKTQHEAIEWAKKQGHTPHVARVRHLNKKGEPGHWRKARFSALPRRRAHRSAGGCEAARRPPSLTRSSPTESYARRGNTF